VERSGIRVALVAVEGGRDMAGRLSGESPVRSKPVRFGKLVELFVSDRLVVRFVAL